MLRNYFTLCQAAMELHELLAGGKLMEIHSQEKNEITLGFTSRDARRMQIIVVARSPKFTFFTREGGQRKQRNSASLMEIVHGMMVGGVYVSPSDREIIITLEGSCALVMRLYSSNTNVLLVEENRITEAFKESLTLAGQHYPPPEKGVAIVRHLETLANSEALFREKLEATDPDEALEKRLSRVLCGFDMFLVRKVLDRSGTKRGTTELHEAFGELFYDLLSPLPAVFISKQGEPELTILGTNEALHQVTFERVLEALNRYTTLMQSTPETTGTDPAPAPAAGAPDQKNRKGAFGGFTGDPWCTCA